MGLSSESHKLLAFILKEQKVKSISYQVVNNLNDNKPVDKVVSQFEDILFSEFDSEFDQKIKDKTIALEELLKKEEEIIKEIERLRKKYNTEIVKKQTDLRNKIVNVLVSKLKDNLQDTGSGDRKILDNMIKSNKEYANRSYRSNISKTTKHYGSVIKTGYNRNGKPYTHSIYLTNDLPDKTMFKKMFGQIVDWKKSEFKSGGNNNSIDYFDDSEGIYNNNEAIDFSEYNTVLSSDAVSLKKICEKEITVYEKKLSSETLSMFHRFILRNNEYKLVEKELDRVANKVALATMKSLASFRDNVRALEIDNLKTDVTFDPAAELAKLDAAETNNQNDGKYFNEEVVKNYLQSIKDSLELVEERILLIELKGALEVKTNMFKLAGRVNKPGAKIKTSELIKYCKEVLAKKSKLIEDDTYDLSNLRDKDPDSNLKKQILKEIEDYKENQKGLVRLDLSVYEDGKEFTEEEIIKYYAKKLGGQNYAKKHYEKPFEDNQQEGF
ncbi:6766_t:CDS:2 [Funneliformis caledonium]|uniref:6766_t:CDS:1 n=1 Tax=Funneliformis caledonium TaxID=1117310 RepID=A0A9N9FS20_9GLOM|nr:6766_t:CDS:2 [Funneliformis caledonium]